MKARLRWVGVVALLSLVLIGCDGLLQELIGVALGEEELPLFPIGGIPIEMEAQVAVESREAMDGEELQWLAADWTHSVAGHLSTAMGWKQESQAFVGGYAQGRVHCYSPCGPEHDVTATWAAELSLDDPLEQPEFIIRIYDDEALVLYGIDHEIACQVTDMNSEACCGLEAWWWGEDEDPSCTHYVYMDYADADRAPDADSSSLAVVQSGVVLLRIPLDELREGTSVSRQVSLTEDEGGGFEHSLDIAFTLTSEGA